MNLRKALPGSILLICFMFTHVSQSLCVPVNQVNLSKKVSRTWLGPELWSNPMQDWFLRNGRMECVSSGGGRNVFLLTYELNEKNLPFSTEVSFGRLGDKSQALDQGWVGFLIGIRGDFNDYRDNAVRGEGFPAGLRTDGTLFIGEAQLSAGDLKPDRHDYRLRLEAKTLPGAYHVILTVMTPKGKELARLEADVDNSWITGGIGLSCSYGNSVKASKVRNPVAYGNWGFKPGTDRKGNVRFWFSDWTIDGDKFEARPERAWGPILFCQYTLSRGMVKLTAQMAPVGKTEPGVAALEINRKGVWAKIATAAIDTISRTAAFRIDGWKESRDVPYRIVYTGYGMGNKLETFRFEGTIRREPVDKEEIVVAAFTGNNDLGFPNNDIVKGVTFHDPDLLFFSGDQIYEGVGGFGIQTAPLNLAVLDYLRKWYLYGWAYGNLLKDRPSVAIPDDHDVYHGNIWGAGGKPTPRGLTGAEAQDQGGYKMPAEWVNMVQRTQTSHLPDPVDPDPVEQGIGVYFTDLRYAGISFAVIEDRKFKSAPSPLLPEAKIYNGFPGIRSFSSAVSADVPGASLLGVRQESFLDQWSTDWTQGTWMKVVLSQTIFANVATLPKEESLSDNIVPRLRVLKEGEYPENDTVVQDFDSDAWPQAARNRTVRIMRKAYALHIAGDQHLGSVIQYGADQWRDGSYAFCVPAISNVWPRRWCPKEPGYGRFELDPRYTGDYSDGFGNKITVYAVSNPTYTGKEPAILYDRATGYGIVRFNRETRDITMECWPRLSDPSNPESRQYPGWPVRINQLSNRNKYSNWVLPLIKVPDMKNSVIQIVSESTGEIQFSVRIKGNAFQPMVDKPGKYTLWVGEPGSDRWVGIPGFEAIPSYITQEYVVRFN